MKPLIPESIRGRIKTVVKQSCSVDADGNTVQQTTNDDVWLPSHREMLNSDSCETSGAVYSTLFINNDSRMKQKYGASSAAYWWLRSAASTSNFKCVYTSGSGSYTARAHNSCGVALGFCT